MSRAETSPAAPAVSEWEPPGPAARPRGRAGAALLLALPVAVAVGFAVALGTAGLGFAIAIVVAEIAWLLAQPRVLSSGAAPADASEHRRAISIVKGVAADLGMPAPRLLVSSARTTNALVLPGTIVLTDDLLGSYTRTELEAVVAHCLVRLRAGGLGWGLASAAAGGLGGGGVTPVDELLDARTAAVTRYPPALASAIRKATPARGRAAALWFVADAPSHVAAEARAAAISDL